MTKQVNIRLVGIALLPALAVSVAAILLGKAVGFSEAVAERVAQILFFAVFLGACYTWRHRFDRVRRRGGEGRPDPRPRG
jgi:hypothetical protein